MKSLQRYNRLNQSTDSTKPNKYAWVKKIMYTDSMNHWIT